MLATCMQHLDDFVNGIDFNKVVTTDVETISFDDKVKALLPYHGHRISMIGLCQGECTIEIPIRHRTEGKRCLDIDLVREWMIKFHSKVKVYRAANIKFEGHFYHIDGISMRGVPVWEDVQLLARVVRNDIISQSLDYITKRWCSKYKKEGEPIDEWCKANDTEDYGRIPIDMLSKYLSMDMLSTEEVGNVLLTQLPKESENVWEVEKEFTKNLWDCEHAGLKIDKNHLIRAKINRLVENIKYLSEINKLVGFDINPGSTMQIGNYFNSLGIHSHSLTDKGEKDFKRGVPRDKCAESWDGEALELTPHPVADLLVKYKDNAYAISNFIDSWCAKVDDTGHIHPTFKSGGTKSGRVSSSQPNAQNYPDWVANAIQIPAGYVGIKWDWSQIEYRIFVHYGNDEAKIEAYNINPDIDAHQLFADKLGLPRRPVKSVNFGVIFGMGNVKMRATLVKDLSTYSPTKLSIKVIEGDKNAIKDMEVVDRVLKAMRKYLLEDRTLEEVDAILPYTLQKDISIDALGTCAPKILEVYHRESPEIKKLQAQVKDIIRTRGYVKNFYGRRYYLDVGKAYIGLNRIVQGTAADSFKRVCNKIIREKEQYCPSMRMVNNIHDAVKGIVKIDEAQAYYDLIKRETEVTPFRVPLRSDVEVALYNWGNYTRVQDKNVIATLAGLYTPTRKH